MTSDDNSPARRRRRGQTTSSMQPRFPSNRDNRGASKAGDRVPSPRDRVPSPRDCVPKTEDRVSKPEVRVSSPAGDPAPSEAEVFEAFASWKLRENPDAWVGTVDDWNINPYEDAFVISPSGRRRSNRLHLIKGEKGIGFAPSMMSVETAYRELVSGTDSHRHCES